MIPPTPQFRTIGTSRDGFLYADRKGIITYHPVSSRKILSSWQRIHGLHEVHGRRKIAGAMEATERDEALLRRLFIQIGLVYIIQPGVWCGIDHKKQRRPPGAIEPGLPAGIRVTDDAFLDNPDSFSTDWCDICQPVIIGINNFGPDAVRESLGDLEGKVVKVAMRGAEVAGVLDRTMDITSKLRRFASGEGRPRSERPDHPLNPQQDSAFVLTGLDTTREEVFRDPSQGCTNEAKCHIRWRNITPAVVVTWKDRTTRRPRPTERSDVTRRLYPLGVFSPEQAAEALAVNRTNVYKFLRRGIGRGEIEQVSRGRFRCTDRAT